MKWKNLESRTVVKDKWIHIQDHTVELPNGMVLYNFYGVDIDDWAVVFPLTKEGNVVLVKQYRHGLRDVFFELPCGIVDPGEEAIISSERELKEETGYTTSEPIIELGKVNPSPAKFNNWNHCFLATKVKKTHEQDLEEAEQIEVVEVPLLELKPMIHRGEIVDSFMISCIYFALDKIDELKLF